jgi:hypothetical protein
MRNACTREDYHKDWKWLSYLATAGKAKPHSSLTTDWVLGQFNRKRGKAEQEYRQFVHRGIGQKTIWTAVRGLSLLGEDTFMAKLIDRLKKHKNIPETKEPAICRESCARGSAA